MPVVVQCNCGGKFQAPDNLLGKVVPCPNCQAAIQIPAAQPPTLNEDPLGAPSGAAYDPLATPAQTGGYQNPGYQAGGYQNPGYTNAGYGATQQAGQPPASGKKLPMPLIIGGAVGAAVLLVGVIAAGFFVFAQPAAKPVAQTPPQEKPAATVQSTPSESPVVKKPQPIKPEPPAAKPEPAAAPEVSLAESVTGMWRITRLMGRDLTGSDNVMMLELRDGKITMDGSGLPPGLAYKLDDSKEPAHFDFKLPDGKTVETLISVTGDSLRLALPPRGSLKRPKSFNDAKASLLTAMRNATKPLPPVTKVDVAEILKESMWRMTLIKGRPVSADDELILEFYKGQVWAEFLGDKALDCSIDPSKSPAHINIKLPESGEIPGLIEFRGDVMRLSLPKKNGRKRPAKMTDHDGIYLTAVRYVPPPVVSLRPESGAPPVVAWCNQTTKVTSKFKDLPFDKALAQLEKDAGMRLRYRAAERETPMSLNISDGNIWEAARQFATDDVAVSAVQGGVIMFEPTDEFETGKPVGEAKTHGVFHIQPREGGNYRLLAEPKFCGEMTAYEIQFTDDEGERQLVQYEVEMTDHVSANSHGRYFRIHGVHGEDVASAPQRLYALFDVVTATEPQKLSLDKITPQHKPLANGTVAIQSNILRDGRHSIQFQIRGKLAAGFRDPREIQYTLITPAGERIPAVRYTWGGEDDEVDLGADFPAEMLGETPLGECKIAIKSTKQTEVVTEPLKNYMLKLPRTSRCEIQKFSVEKTTYYGSGLKRSPALEIEFQASGARIPQGDIRLEINGQSIAPVDGSSDHLQPIDYSMKFVLPREVKDMSKISITMPMPTKVEQHALDVELPPVKQ